MYGFMKLLIEPAMVQLGMKTDFFSVSCDRNDLDKRNLPE